MSNLSILEKNIIHSLGGSSLHHTTNKLAYEIPSIFEEMEFIFLRFKDKSIVKAERCASEWGVIASFLTQFDIPKDAVNFIKERQIRRHFPGF